MGDILYTSKQVSIIGAGGLAREIDSWISTDANTEFEVLGFWDDNDQALEKYTVSKPLFGPLDSEKLTGSLLLGIMDCTFKQNTWMRLKDRTDIFFRSYVHSSVLIGERTILGEGAVVFPNAIISCDVNIGKCVFINLGVQVGHDVTIGDFVSIMPNVDLGGGVVVEDNVFIGSGATILPGVKIAANSRIGAGSVVIKSIKNSGTYFGNPAKKIF